MPVATEAMLMDDGLCGMEDGLMYRACACPPAWLAECDSLQLVAASRTHALCKSIG